MKFRWLTVAGSLLAASAFALSVQAGRWWTIGDVEIGPSGSHSPFAGQGSLTWTGGSVQWLRFGKAAWGAGLIAMFVLVVVGGAVAARRVPKLAAKTALVAILTAAATGAGFIATRPSNSMPFELGRGIALFAAAVVIGLVVAVGVLRAPKPPPARNVT